MEVAGSVVYIGPGGRWDRWAPWLGWEMRSASHRGGGGGGPFQLAFLESGLIAEQSRSQALAASMRLRKSSATAGSEMKQDKTRRNETKRIRQCQRQGRS